MLPSQNEKRFYFFPLCQHCVKSSISSLAAAACQLALHPLSTRHTEVPLCFVTRRRGLSWNNITMPLCYRCHYSTRLFVDWRLNLSCSKYLNKQLVLSFLRWGRPHYGASERLVSFPCAAVIIYPVKHQWARRMKTQNDSTVCAKIISPFRNISKTHTLQRRLLDIF